MGVWECGSVGVWECGSVGVTVNPGISRICPHSDTPLLIHLTFIQIFSFSRRDSQLLATGSLRYTRG